MCGLRLVEILKPKHCIRDQVASFVVFGCGIGEGDADFQCFVRAPEYLVLRDVSQVRVTLRRKLDRRGDAPDHEAVLPRAV